MHNVVQIASNRDGLLTVIDKTKYMTSYLIYIGSTVREDKNTMEEKYEINMLHQISPKVFRFLSSMYNYPRMKRLYKQYITTENHKENMSKATAEKYTGIIVNYYKTIVNVLRDIRTHYDKRIWNKIGGLEDITKGYIEFA